METIYEDREELSGSSVWARLMSFFRPLKAATLPVSGCISIVLVVLSTVLFTYAVLDENILDAFFNIAFQSESIASAYAQILRDLKYAFVIIGGLLSDCVYGRIPLLSSSFLVYTVTLSLSLLITAFFYPSCYLLFALMSFSSPSIPSSILSSFAFGLVFVSALTLLLNYASLKPTPKPLQLLFITMQFLSSLVTRSMIVAASLSSFLVRAVMHAFPFLFAFRLLSLSAILLLLGISRLLFSSRHHFINIPLQGNPVKDYSKAARILSREYHFSLLSKDKDGRSSDVLCRASNDFYNRSISHDSVDATDGSPTILRSSSLDCYYLAQEVYVPSTASLPSAISGASDVNALMFSNCDEPPSAQTGTCIRVLRPLPANTLTQKFIQSRKEEESLREMATLFRNGIRTNLTGQIYRVSQALLCAGMQVVVWAIFEYSQSVLLSQLDVIEAITEPSPLRFALTDCAAPLARLLLALLFFFGIQHTRRHHADRCTPLQLLGAGYALLVVQLLLAAFANHALLLAQSSRLSLGLLLLPSLFLAAAETLIFVGSLLFFYQESPRRSQAILLSLPFAARYCGSLVFYATLPILNAICNIGSQTGSILRYEIGLVVQCVFTIVLLALHTLFALRYDYVTEAELDQECESLKAERILHPYLMKVDPAKKNRSKSCESSRSSSTASRSPRSISDEIVLMNKL
ncbi:hypothetical protein AV274_6591 [Blastocystis sp. ATCC 50177/Nand II]|uniref:Uncharacterized protein n=1 Tax=Blastocystis sp. subtype 1 (strain ATCC 50177 / NandII) TaxID=478820 RepID=A0A196S5Q9_BLAHN|nr:hypothetical protein AV274_6591 [Blastocystis sp. ATCC 50177/Nand II]